MHPSLVWNEPMACTRFGQCKSARQKALFLDLRAELKTNVQKMVECDITRRAKKRTKVWSPI
ncbi:MAG: hypothetical protein CL912_19495 [Deltaproteobacteria bacterium]|nr:hypothetical protein [Deltaproteobacteria bacterium]